MSWASRGRSPTGIAVSLAIVGPFAASAQGPASTVELAAIRAALVSYRPGRLTIDSVFARPDQAPPAMTLRIRPASRQRTLVDSTQSLQVRGRTDTLRVRASEPLIRGDTATISVTVDGRLAEARPSKRFYETVQFVLVRGGVRWVIFTRTQLGVS